MIGPRVVLLALVASAALAGGLVAAPAPPVEPVSPERFAEAVDRTPADPMLLRLSEPGALGPARVTWDPAAGERGTNVRILAGAWALQPTSPEAAERLRYWLELMEEHGFELSRQFPVPGLAPSSPARERALRWLASARVEALAGHSDAARACLARARAEPAAPEVPAAWFDLALAGPAFAPDLARARTAHAAGRGAEALGAYRAACVRACSARDGVAAVEGLLAEAEQRFPGDGTLAAIRAASRQRRGRGAPDLARGWALAAVEALRHGERSEAVKRLAAARSLFGPGGWGPGSLAPWYWAAEDWLAVASLAPGSAARGDGELPDVGVRLPPGMWLAWTDPERAVQLAQPQRWAQRARETNEPRLILKALDAPGRLAEGIVVRLEQEMRRGRFLQAMEILEELRRFAGLDPGEPLQRRVKALGALAREGEPPPDPAPLAGGDAEQLLAALDTAVVAADEGNAAAAWLSLDGLEPELATHPGVRLVAMHVARISSDTARLEVLASAALRADPADVRALAARGWVALAAGRPAAALPDLGRATAAADCPAWGWLARGRALGRLGRFSDAATAFGRAWDLAPGGIEALKGIARASTASNLSPSVGSFAPEPPPWAWPASRPVPIVEAGASAPVPPDPGPGNHGSRSTAGRTDENSEGLGSEQRREAGLRRILAMLVMGERWSDCARLLEAARGLLAAGPAGDEDVGQALADGRCTGLAVDLVNRGAYDALRVLLAERERRSAAPAGGLAAGGAEERPRMRMPTGAALLGSLKREARDAWTRPASPYGGGLSRPTRTAYRFLLLAIVLAAWVRLHLFLLSLFQRQ